MQSPFASFGREAILISRCAALSMGGEVFPKGKLFVQEGEGRGLRRRVRALADEYAWSGAAELAPRPSATRLRRRFSRHFPKNKGFSHPKKNTHCVGPSISARPFEARASIRADRTPPFRAPQTCGRPRAAGTPTLEVGEKTRPLPLGEFLIHPFNPPRQLLRSAKTCLGLTPFSHPPPPNKQKIKLSFHLAAPWLSFASLSG